MKKVDWLGLLAGLIKWAGILFVVWLLYGMYKDWNEERVSVRKEVHAYEFMQEYGNPARNILDQIPYYEDVLSETEDGEYSAEDLAWMYATVWELLDKEAERWEDEEYEHGRYA
ncbi:MAG: hypothetical protein J6Y20_03515 [Lachnospiraceae bacterium]|nr:hypothetical protein [Lachnospiraceae bacterium]